MKGYRCSLVGKVFAHRALSGHKILNLDLLQSEAQRVLIIIVAIGVVVMVVVLPSVVVFRLLPAEEEEDAHTHARTTGGLSGCYHSTTQLGHIGQCWTGARSIGLGCCVPMPPTLVVN